MDYTKPPEVVEEKDPTKMKLDAVVSHKKIKKGVITKIFETFVKKDVKEIRKYAIESVVVPKVWATIVDIICYISGASPSQVEKVKSVVDVVSYEKIFDQKANTAEAPKENTVPFGSLENIAYKSKRDAETVLKAMKEVIGKYGLITIENWFDLSEKDSGDNHQLYCSYGWRDLSKVPEPYYSGGSWYLNLPKAQPINK